VRRFELFDADAVTWAAFANFRPHFGGRKNRSSPAQKAGIRYEYKAQDYLEALYPVHYVRSPWLMFRLKGEPIPRFCQPDGIIVEPERSRIIIVEIKLRHCAEAYTQVTGIYAPVLRKIFPPPWGFRFVELTRWYDPAVSFPAPIQKLSDISLVPGGRFGVHIWNP
jgi:hypothetical protein